jgi:hypothetical protein
MHESNTAGDEAWEDPKPKQESPGLKSGPPFATRSLRSNKVPWLDGAHPFPLELLQIHQP